MSDLIAERDAYARDELRHITDELGRVFGEDVRVVRRMRDLVEDFKELARLRAQQDHNNANL